MRALFVVLVCLGVALGASATADHTGHSFARDLSISEDESGLYTVSFSALGEHFHFPSLRAQEVPEFKIEVDGVYKKSVRRAPLVTLHPTNGERFPLFTLEGSELHKGHFQLANGHPAVIEQFWLYSLSSPADDALDQLEAKRLDSDKYVVYDIETLEHLKDCGCGHDDEIHLKAPRAVPDLPNLTSGRYVSPVPSPCPSSLQTMSMGIAVDSNAFTSRFGSNENTVQSEVADLIAFLSTTYANTLNIQVTLGELVIRTQANNDPWNSAANMCPDPSTKLNQFTTWRADKTNYGLWHLLTNCWQSGTVGLAWTGVSCVQNSNQNPDGTPWSNTAVSSYISGNGHGVVAHESGHNMGAPHDQGIMIPSNIAHDEFTANSQTSMCTSIFPNNDNCLSAASCTPSCAGKTCGSNGCGGSCGSCGSGQNCNSSGQCEAACVPNCAGKSCGPNGCGGTCGSCNPSTESCNAGTCELVTGNTVQQSVLNAINARRTEYGLSSIGWNAALGNQALQAINACSFSAVDTSVFTANAGRYIFRSAQFNPSSDAAVNAINSVISDADVSYSCSSDSCSSTSNYCGFYRQVIYQNVGSVVCVAKTCPGNTSPWNAGNEWSYMICVAEGTVGTGTHPLGASSSCSAGSCQVSSTCTAQGAQCGTIFDGCNTVTCGAGSCSGNSVCQNNVCVCQPQTTCLTNQCGSINNGCGGTLNCGGCGTNQACQNNQCVASCTPTTATPCANKNCGTVSDGCDTFTCGSCQENQACESNVCVDLCAACSPFASCDPSNANSICTCNAGYVGDGNTCTVETNPSPVCSGTEWALQHGANSVFSFDTSADSCVISASGGANENTLLFAQTHALGSESIWAVKVTRSSSTGQIGIVAGGASASANYPNGFYSFFYDANQGGMVFLAKIPAWGWEWRVNWPTSVSWPVGATKTLSIEYLADGYVLPKVDGTGNNKYSVGGWPSSTKFGVFSKSAVGSFHSFALLSQNTLVIDLWGCFTDEEVKQTVANMLGISSTDILNVVGNDCGSANKKRDVAPTSTVTLTIQAKAGGPSASAFSSKLAAALSSGGSPISGSVTGSAATISAAGATAATGPVPVNGGGGGGGGLSGGEIAGIVVGSVAGAVLIGGAVAYVATRNSDEEDVAPSEQRKSGVFKRMSMAFRGPRGGVDLTPGSNPDKHKSLTARAATGYD